MERSYHPELVFPPHFLKIVVEVNVSGHVSKQWLGVSNGMLPVEDYHSTKPLFESVEFEWRS